MSALAWLWDNIQAVIVWLLGPIRGKDPNDTDGDGQYG